MRVSTEYRFLPVQSLVLDPVDCDLQPIATVGSVTRHLGQKLAPFFLVIAKHLLLEYRISDSSRISWVHVW